MTKEKKIIIITLGCVLGLLLIMLIPKGIDPLENAVVNPINGDIAYTYFNYEYSVICLSVYDSGGNKLFSKNLDSGGGGTVAYFAFSGETLNVCSGRNRKMYAFNRDGSNASENIMSKDELTDIMEFTGWKKAFNKKTFTSNGNTYVYEKAPFPKYIFNNYCKLYIEKNDGERFVIYEDYKS